ncbi:MAG: hypothetical protein LBB88_11225, partial [Planctomycetaceae bacterium]|nr:hypothetical protein [Planctomycetaceae bacterium]
MIKRISVSLIGIMLIVIFYTSNITIAQSNNKSKNDENEILRYRHWLAPIDKINDWPLNDERYVPMRRDMFNDLINSLTEQSEKSNNNEQNKFLRIVMNTKLNGNQLANGNGYFEISQNKSIEQKTDSQILYHNINHDQIIILEPWGQWINLAKTQITTDSTDSTDSPNSSDIKQNSSHRNARLVSTSDGKMLLILPEQNNFRNENTQTEKNIGELNSHSTRRIYFDWSLRGKIDQQGRLQFDASFPRSVEVEFNIETPQDKIISCPSGIVIEDKNYEKDAKTRHWKILIGTKNNATIIVTNKNTQQLKKTNSAYRQSILYNISTSGLEVTTTFLFDTTDPIIDYLELELDSPLVPVAVHCGGEAIHSSFIKQIDRDNRTFMYVDMSAVEISRRHEVALVALAPIVTGSGRADTIVNNNIWLLPRIKAFSTNLFWKETRCSIIVQRPLQTRNLSFQNSVQVRSIAEVGRSPHDTFELKYFNDDAQVGLNIYQEESRINVDSFVQIHLSDDAISGNMIAAIRATEGRRFTFAFPISPNWAIHSVKGIYGDEILSWDIVPAKDLKTDPNQDLRNNNIDSYLSLQLKKPLGTGELLRIQLVGRFLTDSHREFKLTEFSPLSLLLQKSELHLIAIKTESTSRLQYRLQNSVLFEIHEPLDAKFQQLFNEQPEGVLLPLDVRTQETAFKTGRVRPDYTADITGKINIGKYNSTASFKFNIIPRESDIERIYVYFIDTKNTTNKNTAENPVENPAEKNQSTENLSAKNINLSSTLSNNLRQWQWEIFTGSTRMDIYRTEIPQIVQSRIISGRELDDFIAAVADRNLPENFKSGTLWEIRLSTPQNTPFEISATKPITAEKEIIVPFAVLPIALTQYGEMYIESDDNFPYIISSQNLKSIPTDISNRQLNNQSNSQLNRPLNRNIHAAFRFDPIDEMRRVNEPALKLQHINDAQTPPEAWIWLMKLESQYGIDGVIKNCINFHIESRGKETLQIILPDGITVNDIGVVWLDNKQTTWTSKSQNTLTVELPTSERYVTASVEYSYKNYCPRTVTDITPKYPKPDIPVLSQNCIAWFHPDYEVVKSSDKSDKFKSSELFGDDISDIADYLSGKNKKQRKAKLAIQYFDKWISQNAEKNSELTWQSLANGGKQITELLLQNIKTTSDNESYNMAEVKFYVDMIGFARNGITPKSKALIKNYDREESDRDGLTIFISVKTLADGRDEYSFYFTTFLTAGVFQHFDGSRIDEQTWFVDNENLSKFIFANGETSNRKIYESAPSKNVERPQMLNLLDWVQAVQKAENVHWSDTNQSFRRGNISPSWIAYEISDTADVKYFIVRKSLLKNYYWAAFLVVIILTSWRRFSHPATLITI